MIPVAGMARQTRTNTEIVVHPSTVSGRIGKVNAPRALAHSDGGVALILKALNPVGVLMETYSRILAYRVEEKRLSVELERINREAEIENRRIDKAFQLALESLQQRKQNIERNCIELKKELKSKRVSRIDIQKMADKAASKALDSNLSLEERRLYMDLRREIMEDIHKIGGEANALLENMLKNAPPSYVGGFLMNSNSERR